VQLRANKFPITPMTAMKNIRVGILVNGMAAPAWVERMLDMVVKEEGLEIALVVNHSWHAGKSPRRTSAASDWLLASWLALDKHLIKVPNDAFQTVDLSPLLARVDTLKVVVEEDGSCDRFAPADIEAIAAHRVDVFLSLGALRVGDDILQTATCGAWRYEHGGSGIDHYDGPVGVLDILLDSAYTETSLQMRVAHDPHDRTLQRSWSTTHPISIHRNRSICYWKTLAFAPRKLRELRSIGVEKFVQKYAPETASMRLPRNDARVAPSTYEYGKLIVKLATRAVSRKLSSLSTLEQWMLLYRFDAPGALPVLPGAYKQLVPPKDRFWADPFVMEKNGEYVVFLEELEYSKKNGHLSAIRFDKNDCPILPPVKILERPYHLSYPFMFEEAGELYMIPETNQNRAIELYRCSQFPDKWEFVMNLMSDVIAVDTTIWHHGGKYWLFAGMRDSEHSSSSDELCLYFSDTLLSSHWKPHPCNPIVSDIRCARPAGNIFQHQGAWYRPAQDCSRRYGRALTFQRIDRIDEDSYQETAVSRLDADWDENIDRVHTFNRFGRLTFIDGMRRRKRYEGSASMAT
jgi:hypothetical protein